MVRGTREDQQQATSQNEKCWPVGVLLSGKGVLTVKFTEGNDSFQFSTIFGFFVQNVLKTEEMLPHRALSEQTTHSGIVGGCLSGRSGGG